MFGKQIPIYIDPFVHFQHPSDLQLRQSRLPLKLSETCEVGYCIWVGNGVAGLHVLATDGLLHGTLHLLAIDRGWNSIVRKFDYKARNMARRQAAPDGQSDRIR